MEATAYRIKEMGDGFLCSVGYPFNTPEGENVAELAVRTAFRFIEVFAKEVELFNYPRPIHCSIGISFDHIEGYYPKSGTKEYDVYGRAIVLATRYEGIRKRIFKNLDSSIVVIQEMVYQSLSRDSMAKFDSYNLKEENIVVRDDPSALKLYYCLVSSNKMVVSPRDRKSEVKRVLVVDDHVDFLVMMKDFFVSINFKVDALANSRDALEKIEDEDYDIVVTDVFMPNVSGYEIIEKAKRYGCDHIIAITGKEVESKAISHGATGFVKKPFEMDDLLKAIDDKFKAA